MRTIPGTAMLRFLVKSAFCSAEYKSWSDKKLKKVVGKATASTAARAASSPWH